MRLFVALEIPTEIRTRLTDSSRTLRRELPAARWVRAELMHLTLVFLGETDGERLPELDRQLAVAFASSPLLELTITGAGAFPPRGRARVLWAGVEWAGGDLPGLQKAVANAVREATGPLEKGTRKDRFHPHVTLARCKRPWPRWVVDEAEAGFGNGHSTPFSVDHGSLIESTLGPLGPRYRSVSEYPLGEGS